MRPNDVEAEVGEKDEPEPFEYIELIGDLGVDLSMIVVLGMDARKLWMVEGEMEGEKEGIVDEEA